MKIFGYTDKGRSAEDAQPLALAEVTLAATPTELRSLAKFIEAAATRMEAQGQNYDHEHLCDGFKEFSSSPSVIVANANL